MMQYRFISGCNTVSGACLHVGDQFLSTGNDRASRTCSPCMWVASPSETRHLLKDLLGCVLPQHKAPDISIGRDS